MYNQCFPALLTHLHLHTTSLSPCPVSDGHEDEETSGHQAQFSAALQWHQWTAQDLALLLAVSLQLPVSDTAPHFTLAFNYFDQVHIPLLHNNIAHSKDTYTCSVHVAFPYYTDSIFFFTLEYYTTW